MQTRSKSKPTTQDKAVPASKTPVKSKAATQDKGITTPKTPIKSKSAARVKPVPKPGDIVTISGKKEEFVGIAFEDDHIRVDTVSTSARSPDAARFPDCLPGTHSRFIYPESFVPSIQKPGRSRTGLDGTLSSLSSLSSASLSRNSSISSIGTEPHQQLDDPSTPKNTYAGSIGPQRTPRAPRKLMVRTQIQDRSTPSISSVSTDDDTRIFEEEMENLARNKRAWESGLYQDAAYIHRFDTGMASPNPVPASPISPKPLGPCGTELL